MRDDEIPDITPPDEGMGLIAYFWDMRRFKGAAEDRLTVHDIEAWERHTFVELEKWERDTIVSMDRTLGHATMEMLKFHQEVVSSIKLEDKDRGRKRNG